MTTLLMALVAVVPLGILAYQSVTTAQQSFIEQNLEKLSAVRQIKQNQIKGFFSERVGDIKVLASSGDVAKMLRAMAGYASSQKVEAGSDFPVKTDEYAKASKDNEGYLKYYYKTYGYYDIFIISPQGHVMYTAEKESDLGANLASGPLQSSSLGELWRRVMKTNQPTLVDFAPYAPSNGVPASFIGAPIVADGKTVGVVALQISLEALNTIMQERTGMGKSGEAYLVGPDKLMRSDSFLDPKEHSVKASFANPSTGSVDTEGVRRALAGETGAKIIADYRGTPVLSAYAPVEVAGLKWAILAEIDEAEVKSESKAAQRLFNMVILISVIAGALILVSVLITWLTVRHMTRTLENTVERLGSGAEAIAAASDQVNAASQSLAEGASQQAASLEETSSSLEEMASMANQNSDNAQQANTLMDQTQTVMDMAGKSMTNLGQAMQIINDASTETAKIIKTIDEIAFQTNLLALNAAVEAARAGEAGAGFAVVADEVRNLAMRAAEAAKTTSELIEKNMSNIEQGVSLMNSTEQGFNEVGDSSTKVGELVAEISSASAEQAQGVEQINQAALEMDKVTQGVAASAEETAASSVELASQSTDLRDMVTTLSNLVYGGAKQSNRKQVNEKPKRRMKLLPARKEPKAIEGDDFNF